MLAAVVNLKGGTGKTTWAVEVAGHLDAPLVDLDIQGDATIWAATTGHPCEAPLANRAAAVLAAAKKDPRWHVADCPPHEGVLTAHAVKFANLVLVPVAGGPQDLQGWGRMRDFLAQMRPAWDKPQVCLLGNALRRGTGTYQDVLDALKAEHDPAKGIHYLGAVGLRQAVAYAYLEGRTVASRGDEAGGEFRLVLRRLDDVLRSFGFPTRNMEAQP